MIRNLLQIDSFIPVSLLVRQVSASQGRFVWKKTKMSGGDSFLKIRPNPVIKQLDSPEFRAIFSPELEVIIKIFKDYNHEIRLAGGPVR